MAKSQFERILKEIEAIPNAKIIKPNMPIAIAVQEAKNLYRWCQHDKELLVKTGVPKKVLNDLPVRAEACMEAQAVWIDDLMRKREIEKKWKLLSAEAKNLKRELLHHYKHAYRNDHDRLFILKKTSNNGSNAHLIQSLNDLAVIGESDIQLLKKTDLDVTLIAHARDLVREAAQTLGKVNSIVPSENVNKRLRDKAYTYLKSAVDEIRYHGKYVFWKNPERRKGYVCNYHKKTRQVKKAH